MTESTKFLEGLRRVAQQRKRLGIDRTSPFVVIPFLEQMQMCARKPLPVRVCVWCSFHVEPNQHDHASRPVLKLELGEPKRPPPDVEKKRLPLPRTGQFVGIVRPGRNADCSRAAHK